MSKSTKWILIGAVVLVALLIILSKMGVFGKHEGAKVTVEKVTKRTIVEVVNASGKVYPEVEVKISPDISGEVTELYVAEGDTVKKGQLLARIYADIYNLQKDQAASGVKQSESQVATTEAQLANATAALAALKATLDQAQKNFDMQKKLFQDKVISQSEFNVAEASLKTAKANYEAALEGLRSSKANITGAKANAQSAMSNLEKANKDLGRTEITAPMDGVVSLLSIKKGEKVAGNSFNVGTEMLRIADMSKIEVRVDVGENDVPKVRLGDSAIVTIDAYSDKKFKGIVTQIASSNNGAATSALGASTSNDVTQYKVYIRLIPESYLDMIHTGFFPFKPGMSANADIQTQTRTNVLSVPINAVTTREKNDSTSSPTKKKEDNATNNNNDHSMDDLNVLVFVKQPDNKVKKRLVKTGIQDLNFIEITSGLKEGEEVVTGPYGLVSKTLKENDEVKVVDKKELFEKN